MVLWEKRIGSMEKQKRIEEEKKGKWGGGDEDRDPFMIRGRWKRTVAGLDVSSWGGVDKVVVLSYIIVSCVSMCMCEDEQD